MSLSRFNFNLISHKDLRKYLTKKMESLRWEFSSAYDSTLAHYSYHPSIAYNFVHGKNMKITIKKILFDLECDFILPFLHFNKKNMDQVLEENSNFLDDGIFFFRTADGKKELSNHIVKNNEEIQKIVQMKYKSPHLNFILEKSDKKMAIFEGELFDLRMYTLVVRMGPKYYTLLYPTIFANFKNDDINKKSFTRSLGLGELEEISGTNNLMKDIYLLIQKTSVALSNYLEITYKIFRLEKDIRKRETQGSDLQFNLYGIDIIINSDRKPILSDIVVNPTFGLMSLPQKILREKIRIYDDIIENFVVEFSKTGKINTSKSDFVILNKTPPEVQYRLFITKKVDTDQDETIDYKVENNEFITTQGELLVQNLLDENKLGLDNDNHSLNVKLGMKPKISESYYNSDNLIEKMSGGLGDEYTFATNLYEDLNHKIPDTIIESKINELYQKEESNKSSVLGLAGKTIPILGLMYAAKKTYTNYSQVIKDKLRQLS